MVLDMDYLKIQSECQQYIDDVLAHLRFGYTDQVDLTLNVTLTPFKERFQDEVAGMTATLEIIVPLRLTDCYNPIQGHAEPPAQWVEVMNLDITPDGTNTDPNYFEVLPNGTFLYSNLVVNSNDPAYMTENFDLLITQQQATYRYTVTATLRNSITESQIEAEQAVDPTIYADVTPGWYLDTDTFSGADALVLAEAVTFNETTGVDYSFTGTAQADIASGKYTLFSMIAAAQPSSGPLTFPVQGSAINIKVEVLQ